MHDCRNCSLTSCPGKWPLWAFTPGILITIERLRAIVLGRKNETQLFFWLSCSIAQRSVWLCCGTLCWKSDFLGPEKGGRRGQRWWRQTRQIERSPRQVRLQRAQIGKYVLCSRQLTHTQALMHLLCVPRLGLRQIKIRHKFFSK